MEELLARTSLDGWTPAPDLGDGLVHAIVRWDPSRRRDDGLRADVVYASEPVVDARRGLMVLLLRSPHQGCAVEFCPTSGWFEDPCHGSRFNGWGEWTGGPSPRGLDRRPSRIAYGALEVRPTTWIEGTPRDRRILEQDPMGPSCVQL